MRGLPRLSMLFGLCFPLVLCTVSETQGETGKPADQALAEKNVVAPSTATDASRIYIDPQTGKITTPPPGKMLDASLLELPPSLQNAISTSFEGLVVEPNPGPAGGLRVDLKGRFQNVTMVTIGPDGKPVFKAVTGESLPLAGEK